MAVFGPYQRVTDIAGLSYTKRIWYRQKPITAKPLYYYLEGYYRGPFSGEVDSSSYIGWAVSTWTDPQITSLVTTLYARAYARLKDAVGVASSQLGADFAERKQAYKAIGAHVATLTKAARYLKNGYVLDFFKTLGIKKRTWRTKASDMGGVWLEYSYGWKPLVEDIHSAVDVLQQPWPSKVVRGKAQGKFTAVITNTVLSHTSTTTYTWTLRQMLQMKVSISNWTAWYANELGLTNPAAIAWEVVPFSFVVDWFLPIGNYLQSLTDFVGLNQEDSFLTKYGQVDRHYRWRDYLYPFRNFDRQDRRVDLVRSLSLIPVPSLRPRFTGFYSARGANAIALLTSTLKDLPTVKVRRFPDKGKSLYV